MKNKTRPIVIKVLLLFLFFTVFNNSLFGAELSLHGNFHTIGIKLIVKYNDDPEFDAVANLEYRTREGVYQQGFPLTRVNLVKFAGSMFSLIPNTVYDVRITIQDSTSEEFDGTVIEASGRTKAEIEYQTASKTLFVSPNGSGDEYSFSNPGKIESALQNVNAGEEILLKSGIYHIGNIKFPKSGTNSLPISIRGIERDSVILDGSDTNKYAWENIGNGVYKTSLPIIKTKLVLSDTQRLYGYVNIEDLNNLKYSRSGYYSDNNELYIKYIDDSSPEVHDLTISINPYLFHLDKIDFIHFRNLTIRYYGGGDYTKALYIDNSSYNIIDSCTFAFNFVGVAFKRTSSYNLVQNSLFYDGWFGTEWQSYKDMLIGEAIATTFYDPSYGVGNVIRGNIAHNCFDGFGLTAQNSPTELREVDFYNNEVYDASDDAVTADGGSGNVRIWNNKLHDALVGISIAPAFSGPIYCFRNLIYNIGVGNSNANYTGMAFKFNSALGHSGTIFIFHNTIYAGLPNQDGFTLRVPATWDKLKMRNNIWYGTRYALNNAQESDDRPLDIDYNNSFTSSSNTFARWTINKDYYFSTFEEFQNQTGHELNGISEDPLFMSPSEADFALSESSPAVDRGVLIPGINSDYSGNGPDIGAFESDYTAVAVRELKVLPEIFSLSQNYPNPFNPVTTIEYSIPTTSEVTLKIFDLLGREVATVVNKYQQAGKYKTTLNASSLPSGVYYYQLKAGTLMSTQKLVVLK